MRTLYERLPELSVEPCHDRLTVVVLIFVTTRFDGVVGADLSPFPVAAEEAGPLKSSVAVSARIVIPIVSREKCRVVMSRLLLTNVCVTRVQGLHPSNEHNGSIPTLDEKLLRRTREGKRKISDL